MRASIFLLRMKTINYRILNLILTLTLGLTICSCSAKSEKKLLTFKDYPQIRLGFSSQNFLKALPLDVPGLTEVIEYAASEGFRFVEIRDQFVDLNTDDCKALAEVARKNGLELIYVFNKNLLDPSFGEFFNRALANAETLPGPGILRALASKTEIEADPQKKGWTDDELARLCKIADSCATICKTKNIRFVFENSNEAFFGDSLSYKGLADLFSCTSGTGLQLDIANLFRNSARSTPDPKKVLDYLPSLGSRWVETHLKSAPAGEPLDYLSENPISVNEIIDLMGKQNVVYAALELNALEDKQMCKDNHARSLTFLRDKALLK